MEGSGAGWDSIPYRVLIIGGLIAVVVMTVGTSLLVDPQGRTMLPVLTGGGAATVLLLSIMGYWWYQILVRDYGSAPIGDVEPQSGVPVVAALKNWSTLFNAMALRGGDPQKLELAHRESKGALLKWYGMLNLIAVYPLIFVWLGLLGVLPESFPTAIVIVVGLLVLLGIMLFATPLLAGRATQANSMAYLAPLGLTVVQTPALIASYFGAGNIETILAGERHGRAIEVHVAVGLARTIMRANIGPFAIQSDNGKLKADAAASQATHAALRALRKAKRWAGLSVQADGTHIVAERTTRVGDRWLYDLWLMEYLLEKS